MKKKWISFVVWLAMTAAVSLAALQLARVQAMAAAQPATFPTQLPDDLARAVAEALRTSNTLSGAPFAVTAVQQADDWALVAIAALEGPTVVEGYIGSEDSGRLLLASRVNGMWQVGIEGDPVFTKLLAQAPDALVSAQAKALLMPKAISSPAGGNSTQTVNYKWPWPAGLSWRWLQGWHSRSLDIGTDGADRRILASADGVVTYMCKGSLGAALKVRDADGVVLEYWHIDSALLSGAVQLGATVTQGQWLGTLRPGTWTDNTACGTQYTSQTANSAHVHWVLPTDRTFTVEGWSITSPNSTLSNGSQSRTCNGGCWGSAFFFGSSNVPGGEPNPVTPTTRVMPSPTPSATPTATSTPKVTASMSIEPASLITQTGQWITLSVMLNVAGPVDAAAVAFRLSYNPDLARIEHITPSEGLTNVVISTTLNGVTFAGTVITTALQQTSGPIASLTLSTTSTGLSEIGLASATLTDSSGNALTPTLRNSLIFVVAEWPAARVYLPFVTRDPANEIVPTGTPRPTATSIASLTATATVTPMPTESSTTTSTSTSTIQPASTATVTSTPTIPPASTATVTSTPSPTLLPIDTQTPTPTSTLVDGR